MSEHNQNHAEFKREDRYIVIKRSDLEKVPFTYRRTLVEPLKWLQTQLPARKYLVMESDWPEYPIAWRMIEARVTAAQQPGGVAVPAAVLVGREWLRELQKYVSSFEKQDQLRAILAAGEQKPACESAEDRFEHYLQNAIDNAPEPLRRLGEDLAQVIDEDEWATAERMLNGAIVAAQDVAGLMREHRIAVTPEHEGQWHADLYGHEAEPLARADGDTPEAAVHAVVAAYRSGSPAGQNLPQQEGDQ